MAPGVHCTFNVRLTHLVHGAWTPPYQPCCYNFDLPFGTVSGFTNLLTDLSFTVPSPLSTSAMDGADPEEPLLLEVVMFLPFLRLF